MDQLIMSRAGPNEKSRRGAIGWIGRNGMQEPYSTVDWPAEVAGSLREQAAEALNLPAGIRVVTGTRSIPSVLRSQASRSPVRYGLGPRGYRAQNGIHRR